MLQVEQAMGAVLVPFVTDKAIALVKPYLKRSGPRRKAGIAAAGLVAAIVTRVGLNQAMALAGAGVPLDQASAAALAMLGAEAVGELLVALGLWRRGKVDAKAPSA